MRLQWYLWLELLFVSSVFFLVWANVYECGVTGRSSKTSALERCSFLAVWVTTLEQLTCEADMQVIHRFKTTLNSCIERVFNPAS